VLLAGPVGVRPSADGGETFYASTANAVRQAQLLAFDQAGSALVVRGVRAIASSTDGGASWRGIKAPRKQLIRDLDFVSPQTGYLLDMRGRLWRTTNAGRKWGLLNTAGTTGSMIDFTDAMSGYMVGSPHTYIEGGAEGDSSVLRTSDGGLSWRPQLISLDAVQALESAGGTDYALVGESSLFATTTAGYVGAPQELSIRTKKRVLKKAGEVSVSGKLTPADGGETVVVSQYAGKRWLSQGVLVAANGSFATRWQVRSTSVFVAQVLGDADHAGAGTKPLTVKVVPAKRKPKKNKH
jgi:hypothetical protein